MMDAPTPSHSYMLLCCWLPNRTSSAAPPRVRNQRIAKLAASKQGPGGQGPGSAPAAARILVAYRTSVPLMRTLTAAPGGTPTQTRTAHQHNSPWTGRRGKGAVARNREPNTAERRQPRDRG